MRKIVRLTFGSLVLAGTAAPLCAQAPPKLDMAIVYTSTRSLKASSQENFWSKGGSVELGLDAWRGVGIAANVTGLQASSIGSSGIPLSLVSATFGPRYRWHSRRRTSAYGEVLLGEANGFRSLFPAASGADASSHSLALQAGGGIDVALSRHLAVRALDVGWLRTQLPNGTDDRQNSLRLGAGMVIRFGP